MSDPDSVKQKTKASEASSITGKPSIVPDQNIIHDVFLLGWSILELKSRILFATSESSNDQTLRGYNHMSTKIENILRESASRLTLAAPPGTYHLFEDSDGTMFTTNLRTLFNRIAFLHFRCLSNSDTVDTIYDLPSGPSVFPYLYPESHPDYANIGVRRLDFSNDLINDPGVGINFSLYDITRRAINCLIHLYTQPDETPNAEHIAAFQEQIISAFLNRPPSDETISLETISLGISSFSRLTVSFLTAWDSYLRENILRDGRLDDKEVMLIAYEAGRSLSPLVWSIPLLISQNYKRRDDPDFAMLIYDSWCQVFNVTDISAIQRKISALGSVLNNIEKEQQSSNDNLASLQVNAVKDSVVYWYRALVLLRIVFNDFSMRLYLKEHSESFFMDLHSALIEQVDIWQGLLLGRDHLNSFANTNLTTAIYNHFIKDFENAMNGDLLNALSAAKRRSRTTTVLVILVILLLIVLFVPWPGLQIKTLVTAFVGTATLLVGLTASLADVWNKMFKSQQDSNQSSTERFANIFGLSNTDITNAFKTGEQNILSKYSHFDHSIGISYPLFQFVGIISGGASGKQTTAIEYDFLTKIVWQTTVQEEEMKREVRSFFGLIGTFVSSRLNLSQLNLSQEKKSLTE